MDDLLDADATTIAAAVNAGEVTAVEVVEACLQRLDDRNPIVNAVVALVDDAALAAAATVGPGAPLAGVPIVVKDLGATVASMPATRGSRLFADVVADADSEIVTRYRRAGAVVVGTTNTPEFGLNASTEPLLHGPTRNPYGLDRSPGGSSGGTAAAVAAGIVPVGHGTDGGGSIRIPASCCGLVGLKPSRGRTPAHPRRQTFAAPLSVHHVLTRTVRDSALLLDLECGAHVGDALVAPVPGGAYVDELGRDPGRCVVALRTRTPAGDPVHPACAAAAEDAARLLESLGHTVVDDALEFPVDVLRNVSSVLMSAPMAADVDERLAALGRSIRDDDLEPFTHVLYETGRAFTGAEVVGALRDVERAAQEIGPFFADHDLLLTPTSAEPAPPLGLLDTTNVEAMYAHAARYSTMTSPFNATGQPAISLPLARSSDGVPIGVQLVAAIGREDLLLSVAAQLEAAAPWRTRPCWPAREDA